MSLQYIIDGYNLTNHPSFSSFSRRAKNPRAALIFFLKTEKAFANRKNKITIVFDGFPPADEEYALKEHREVVFSRQVSADESIKNLLGHIENPKNTFVVSDDKEVRCYARAMNAKVLFVNEFLMKASSCQRSRFQEPFKPELSLAQIDKINKELRQIWLV